MKKIIILFLIIFANISYAEINSTNEVVLPRIKVILPTIKGETKDEKSRLSTGNDIQITLSTQKIGSNIIFDQPHTTLSGTSTQEALLVNTPVIMSTKNLDKPSYFIYLKIPALQNQCFISNQAYPFSQFHTDMEIKFVKTNC